jgi:hypothetical protein
MSDRCGGQGSPIHPDRFGDPFQKVFIQKRGGFNHHPCGVGDMAFSRVKRALYRLDLEMKALLRIDRITIDVEMFQYSEGDEDGDSLTVRR